MIFKFGSFPHDLPWFTKYWQGTACPGEWIHFTTRQDVIKNGSNPHKKRQTWTRPKQGLKVLRQPTIVITCPFENFKPKSLDVFRILQIAFFKNIHKLPWPSSYKVHFWMCVLPVHLRAIIKQPGECCRAFEWRRNRQLPPTCCRLSAKCCTDFYSWRWLEWNVCRRENCANSRSSRVGDGN